MSRNTASSPRVVVIGAGMAGVLAAIKCREAGLFDLTVYEKADRLGGTWRENTYPGVACDVPSHLYSYSFAPNPGWSTTFAPGPEILDYLTDVARQHRIEEVTCYGQEVCRLERIGGRWNIETKAGMCDEADVVIAATGVLHHPQMPKLEGVGDFEGAVFHSARWDHNVPLKGQKVGVVGTGSSAVQIVGALVDTVDELRLFQRTPQWVVAVPNDPIADADRELYEQSPDALRERRDELASTFEANFANAVVDMNSPQLELLQQLCLANLETVRDPELRERLRPNYRAACKRLIISPGFYDAIQRPNAWLVTDGIDHVEPRGVRTVDGRLHELDVLVLATGFRVDRFLRPMEVIGRNGARLSDVWSPRPTAYLSVSVPDFPNLFLLNGPNGPVGNFSLIDVAELQLAYVLQLVERIRAGDCREVSATPTAATRFEEQRTEAAKQTVWVTGCRSWYLDDRGVPAAWPWSFTHFREVMAAPDLADFDLRS